MPEVHRGFVRDQQPDGEAEKCYRQQPQNEPSQDWVASLIQFFIPISLIIRLQDTDIEIAGFLAY